MTREEVKAVLCRLKGERWLIAALMYGTGMRLMECLRLRLKDLDFGSNQITIREGKGDKDQMTMLRKPLLDHLERVKKTHARDLTDGYGRVLMPNAIRPSNVISELSSWIRKTESIQTRQPNGAGNGCFRKRTAGRTIRPESKGGATQMNH